MRRALITIIAITVAAFAAATVYRVFFLQFVRVPTGSMRNMIIPGDHLVLRKRVGTIERGDLIVLRLPPDPSVRYVSRVIGLPGESIQVRGRVVSINGQELKEQRVMVKPEDENVPGLLQEVSSEGTGPYRVYYGAHGQIGPAESRETPFAFTAPFQIPENSYFVMGDNRDNSYDSRYWGAVSRDAVTGKPTMIYWSVSRDQAGSEEVRWKRIFSGVH